MGCVCHGSQDAGHRYTQEMRVICRYGSRLTLKGWRGKGSGEQAPGLGPHPSERPTLRLNDETPTKPNETHETPSRSHPPIGDVTATRPTWPTRRNSPSDYGHHPATRKPTARGLKGRESAFWGFSSSLTATLKNTARGPVGRSFFVVVPKGCATTTRKLL